MKKEKIIKIIKKQVVENVEDIDIKELNENISMKDLGANSLDMIEIVSGTMRELKIKIPRTELSDITNINDLAEKIMEYLK